MSVESVKETQTDIENILTVKRNPVYYKHVTFEQDVVKNFLTYRETFIRYKLSSLFRSSSVVELSAVNRSVVGSSPTAEPYREVPRLKGPCKGVDANAVRGFESLLCHTYWPVGQVVKTPPFHGGNTGSNPVRVTTSED